MGKSSRIRLAFDAEAPDYDRNFSSLPATQSIRAAIWEEIRRQLPCECGRVLDLGCGTGEDAAFLARSGYEVVATDVSGRMLFEARKKLASYPNAHFLQTRIEEVPSLLKDGVEFEAILSNFGALNCLSSLAGLRVISELFLKPGGSLFLCMINRFYLRELARGEFRRLRPSGRLIQMKDGNAVRCYYHSPESGAWPGHVVRRVWGLGVFGRSDIWKSWPLNRLGDHWFVVVQKQR